MLAYHLKLFKFFKFDLKPNYWSWHLSKSIEKIIKTTTSNANMTWHKNPKIKWCRTKTIYLLFGQNNQTFLNKAKTTNKYLLILFGLKKKMTAGHNNSSSSNNNTNKEKSLKKSKTTLQIIQSLQSGILRQIFGMQRCANTTTLIYCHGKVAKPNHHIAVERMD